MVKIKYKRKEDKIGEIRLNKNGTPMKLVDYKNIHDCTVEFQDEYRYIFEHANYQNFLKGQLKNPYDKTVFGIGMLGEVEFLTRQGKDQNRAYITWVHLISRCYVDQKLYPSYYEVSTVCDEWLLFQVFADWYEENYYPLPNNERLHLDKDILVAGNKHYSPETCLLVPQKINLLFTNKAKIKKSGLPNGVQRTSNGDKFQASYNTKHLGCFETLDEAYEAYACAKESAIKKRANEYKEIIPTKLYDALHRYKVKIEYDKNYEKGNL